MRVVWTAVCGQVLHSHLWVRGAATRLLGMAFADPAVGALSCAHVLNVQAVESQERLCIAGHGNFEAELGLTVQRVIFHVCLLLAQRYHQTQSV